MVNKTTWNTFEILNKISKAKTKKERLDLLKPVYSPSAAYGHFGRELPGFTWESLELVDKLKGMCL